MLCFPRTALEKRGTISSHHFNADLGADKEGCMGAVREQMKLQPNVFTLSLVT